MALEFDYFEGPVEMDWAAAGRESGARPMSETYTGVGDELAQPDLVCGVAQLAGLTAVESGGTDPHHPLEP